MPKTLARVTWKDDVRRALEEIGRPATTSEVSELVKKIRIAEGRTVAKHSRSIIRRLLDAEFNLCPTSSDQEPKTSRRWSL